MKRLPQHYTASARCLAAAVTLALSGTVSAQSAPAPAASTPPPAMAAMPGMDPGAMGDMAMPAPAKASSTPAAAQGVDQGARPGRDAQLMKPTRGPSQVSPPPSKGTRTAADADASMGAMQGMDTPADAPAAATPTEGMHLGASPAPMHDMASMSGMPSPDATPTATAPPAMHGHGMAMGGMSGMPMGAMQGGKAPPHARSPDYSDGVGYGSMKGMDMNDNGPNRMILLDQLEAVHGRDANGQAWEAQGWYGGDSNKLWLRTEGERSGGKLEEADLEAFWNHAVATYWSTQLGARQDVGPGPNRTWAAFGIQGISPYWFELEATAYAGANGRTGARLRGEYELLLTQRWILQPELELNAYGKDDPQRRLGSGVSDAAFSLRLRYEFRREVAPYIGIRFVDRFGGTADYVRAERQPVFDRQIVAGIRLWF